MRKSYCKTLGTLLSEYLLSCIYLSLYPMIHDCPGPLSASWLIFWDDYTNNQRFLGIVLWTIDWCTFLVGGKVRTLLVRKSTQSYKQTNKRTSLQTLGTRIIYSPMPSTSQTNNGYLTFWGIVCSVKESESYILIIWYLG